MSSLPRAPLADRMRPRTLDEYVGQAHLVGPGRLIRRAIESDRIGSMLLWGPPGSGKTTLAKVIAASTDQFFVAFSAVLQGVKEVRAIVEEARVRQRMERRGTILFVDEIHRFNKAQQDAFLPHVEAGTVVLIGATTENPSFEVNGALLSRCRVHVLEALTEEDIGLLVDRALGDRDRGLGALKPTLDPEARALLLNYANGDARVALSALEAAVTGARPTEDGGDDAERAEVEDDAPEREVDEEVEGEGIGGRGEADPAARGARHVDMETMREAIANRIVAYDNAGEEHYNLISALHKSMRGSDPQAALYWLARMLAGGADPLYIARRLIRFASEDVGLADPQALVQAAAAKDAAHFLGAPECDTALAQAVVYLATAPKSNRIYTAIKAATVEVGQTRNEPPPLSIRNAPTQLMKGLGYGKGYRYDHDAPDGFSGQAFLPDALAGRVYYQAGDLGYEREIAKRMEYWDRLRRERRAAASDGAAREPAPRAPRREGA